MFNPTSSPAIFTSESFVNLNINAELVRWLYTPRASAVFYVPKRNQAMIRSSLPTSHGFVPISRDGVPSKIWNPMPTGDKNAFVQMFEFVATIDPSPYFCIETALKFRQEACGGENKIMKYIETVSDEAGQRMAAIFGTEVMENEEQTLNRSAFSNVRLPLEVGSSSGQIAEEDKSKVMFWMAARLLEDYDTFVALYFHAESFWVRISGQIYLELDDFSRGSEAIQELCKRAQKGEYLAESS